MLIVDKPEHWYRVDRVDVSRILDNKKMLFYYENVCTTASKVANIAYSPPLSSEGVTNADSICPVRVKRYSVVKIIEEIPGRVIVSDEAIETG